MKFDIDSFNEIVATLTRTRSRTVLTGFGIFWGIFMLLFLIGGGAGLRQMLMKNFDGFASNACFLFSGTTTKPYKGMKEGRNWRLGEKDIARLRIMAPELDVVTGTVARWGTNTTYGVHSATGSVQGIAPDYFKVEIPDISFGRALNDVDLAQERKVCVIGERIYNELFPDGSDPCGKYICLGSSYFQVVGVNEASGNISINGRADEKILIPLPVAQKLYHTGTNVDLICLTGKDGVNMSAMGGRLRQIVAREHLFDPTDERALFVFNTSEMFSLIDNLFKGINFLIWLVGLGTILAGAIGVSNIMMVTVRERTVEIGIRRAIGATPWDILSQIILESISLTLVAGALGIMFSVGMLSLLEIITKHEVIFQIGFGTATLAVVIIAALGVVAGLAPATRAMRIKPVDAMRDE
ncbi:MAG: ABC transporter permease [Bacteroidales bacterium]|nr:ABC transporter permease [Bacteroidales bacterium]